MSSLLGVHGRNGRRVDTMSTLLGVHGWNGRRVDTMSSLRTRAAQPPLQRRAEDRRVLVEADGPHDGPDVPAVDPQDAELGELGVLQYLPLPTAPSSRHEVERHADDRIEPDQLEALEPVARAVGSEVVGDQDGQ